MKKKNATLLIVIFLFVYKLLLRPLIGFSTVISTTDDDDDIEEIVDVGRLSDVDGVSLTKKSKKSCAPDGIYLGPSDAPVDCAALCKDSGYRYKFIETENSVAVNYTLLSKRGGYCLPHDDVVVRCNTYTSKLIKTIDGWKCLPKGNLFGGEDGCRIVGCNGFVKDNLTGTYYEGRIPTTLAVSNPEDEYVDDGNGIRKYRFQCTDTEIDPVTRKPTAVALQSTAKDFMGNKLIESPYSRFDRVRNACSSLLFDASDVIGPNFENGTCTCLAQFHADETPRNVRRFVDGYEVVDLPRRCSPCIDGWSEKEKAVNVGLACRKSFDDGIVRGNDDVILPCGVKGFDAVTAACINVKIYASGGLSSFARKALA